MTNFDLAPPPMTVGGRTAVPIDISTVTGALRFDGATGTATGDVTIEFVVGPTTGSPIFDLRQSVTGGWLDGVSVTPAQILTLDLGGGPGAELRVLDRVLAADSAHTLRLTYALGPPSSPAGGSYPPALVWSAGPRLRFTFGFTDLAAARYLESWLPANLIWDQYAIGLELIVTGTAVAHRPITNGAVTTLGVNHWRVDLPVPVHRVLPDAGDSGHGHAGRVHEGGHPAGERVRGDDRGDQIGLQPDRRPERGADQPGLLAAGERAGHRTLPARRTGSPRS